MTKTGIRGAANARPALKRVRKDSVRNQVFIQLRDQILSRVWPPGSKMPSENTLVKSFGVSRVSVREALQMLASLGLLETRQGGGTFVREYSGDVYMNPLFPMLALDKTDLFHVLEYRKVMEKGTVGLVVERAGGNEIAELERAYEVMHESRHDRRAFARADLDFHLVLAKATGNPIIIKVNDFIKSILSVSMDNIVGTLGIHDGLFYHRKIIEAIKAGDKARAETLMEEHVLRTIERLRTETRAADE